LDGAAVGAGAWYRQDCVGVFDLREDTGDEIMSEIGLPDKAADLVDDLTARMKRFMDESAVSGSSTVMDAWAAIAVAAANLVVVSIKASKNPTKGRLVNAMQIFVESFEQTAENMFDEFEEERQKETK
jgi:hypothetical protein